MGLTSPPPLLLLLPPLLLLLCSGFLQVPAARRLRYFRCYCHNKSEIDCSEVKSCDNVRWLMSDALPHCHSLNSSLVTLFDEDDAGVIAELVTSYSSAWLGLTKPKNATITWSDGSPFNPGLITVEKKTSRPCVARDGGSWKSFNCQDKKAFICSKGTHYFLVHEKKSWCRALRHCRDNSGDLASITNKTQENKLTDKLTQTGGNTSFWIGLLHHHWHWDQHTCSDFTNWTEDDNLNCSKLFSNQKPDYQTSRCENDLNLICSEGSVRIVVKEEERSWEEAYDYCRAHHSQLLWLEDERDQRAVEQWLRHRRRPRHQAYWMALRQSPGFGFWFWSGDRFLGEYSNWKNGSAPKPSLSKICGVMEGGTFQWREEECERHLPFLCEDRMFSTEPGSPAHRCLQAF